MSSIPHSHDWEYDEPKLGFTSTTLSGKTISSPAGVLRFCTGCFLMERVELHFAPEKETQN